MVLKVYHAKANKQGLLQECKKSSSKKNYLRVFVVYLLLTLQYNE